MANIVITVGCWHRHATVARTAGALIIRGRVERAGDVTNLSADHLQRLPLAAKTTSRDFR
jgi:error-prone DNA polymerase